MAEEKTLAELEAELDGKQEVNEDFEVIIADDDDDDKQELDRQQQEDDDTPLVKTEEDDDEDDTPFSKSKRVKREIRLKEAARDEARAAEARAVAAEKQVRTERLARLTAEAGKLAADKTTIDVLGTAVENDIKTTSAALVAAREAGKSEDEVALEGKLFDLRAKRQEIEAAKGKLKSQSDEFERVKTDFEHAKPVDSVTPEAKGWMERNAWINDPDFKAARAAQLEIDRDLMKSGKFDPNTKAYFDEMDRRLGREIPTLKARAAKAGLITAEKRSQPSSGVGTVSRGTVKPGKKQVILDKDDFTQMRRWGMNPENKDDRMRWAKTKLENANA